MIIKEVNNEFVISFPYNPKLVNAVKKLNGRRWDPAKKAWTVPMSNRDEINRFAHSYGFCIGEPKPEPKKEYTIPEMPELDIDIPLKLNPYPYQRTGIAYSLKKKRLIIGDQPGLGKTCQAIATITAANAFPCLVICPSSLKLNWQREWHMWTNKKAMILNNTNKSSWHMVATGQSLFGGEEGLAQVFITNYESLKKYFISRIDKPEGKPLRINHITFREEINVFKSVIIDESHRVKDTKTQQTKFTKGICHGKEWILAITGTPVVNKPRDLVAQLGIIDQLKAFGGYKRFIDRYCGGYDGAGNLEELNYLLNKNCFFRREKKTVLKELPDKMRQIVLCDITTRKEYRDALADLEKYLKEYRKATDEQVQRSLKGEVMVRIGILKNISARGKLNDVCEYIKDIVESGEKIIVFVHLKEVASILKAFFPKSVTILGEDDTATRQANIDQFQNDPETQVIICSIKAAGVGITLTASSRVAFVELPWHSADTDQCEDRAHRIGQKNSVQCIYFLGKNTIDENIYKIIDEKRLIANTITGAKEEIEENVMDSVINLLSERI